MLAIEDLDDEITVQWSNRFTAKMGLANCPEMRIVLSKPLWPLASEADRRETVIHEVCHLVDWISNPRARSHGPSWQALMRRCGLEPRRCHDVPIPEEFRRKVERVSARCACRTVEISKQRVARMRKGRIYTCMLCRTPLRVLIGGVPTLTHPLAGLIEARLRGLR